MSGTPILSKKLLEEIANAYTQSFIRYDGKDDPKFSVWKFAAYYLGKKVQFEWLTKWGSILGLSVFEDHMPVPIYIPETDKLSLQEFGKGTILLDKTLDNPSSGSVSRSRFTLMHECAHHILHRDYFHQLKQEGRDCGVAYSLQKKDDIQEETIKPQKEWTELDWLEWQANYLAGALLMPSHRVRNLLEDSVLLPEYRDSVRAKQSEDSAFKYMVWRLAGAFRVSPVTARIRLDQTGFIRLPDLAEKRSSIYDLAAISPQVKRTARERWDEEVFAEWEAHRLDPEYIFPGHVNKSVKKRKRNRHASEKA